MKIPVIVFFITLVASTILIITLAKVYDKEKELVNVGSKSLPPFPDVAPLVAAPEVEGPTTNLCVSLVGDETGGYVPSPMDPLTQCSSNTDCDTCVTSPIEIPLECKAPTELISQQQSDIGNPGSKFCLPQTSACLTQETLLACTHDADCASCSDEVGDGQALQCQIVTSPKKFSLLDTGGEPLTEEQLANMDEEDVLEVPGGQWCLPKTGECHKENGVLHWTTAGWSCACRFPAIHGGDNCSIFKACNNPLTTEWSAGNQQLLVNEDSPAPQVWTMDSGVNPMLCHVEGVTNKAEWDKTCGVDTIPNAVCQCDGLMLESRMGFRNETTNPLTCTPDSCSVNALGGRTTEPLTMVDWSTDPNIPPNQCVCSGADARIWDIDNRNPDEVEGTDPVLAETLRSQQGHVYMGRCRDTIIPTNGSRVVLKANRPRIGLGSWEQFRYQFEDGTRTYVSTYKNRTFAESEVGPDGTVWWKSQEKNTDGETLTELGILEEIQGGERVIYAKMRGMAQWSGDPQPGSIHYPFWSVSESWSPSGSYENPSPYEIARVGINQTFQPPPTMNIPFLLVGLDVDKFGNMFFEQTDPVCALENNKHAEMTSLVPGFAVNEAGNAEVSVCSADPCGGQYSDVNFRPPEDAQDWGHYNAQIGACECVSPGNSTSIDADLTVNPVASVCANACSGMESDDPNDWPCKQDPTRPCPQKPQCLTGEKGEPICVCAQGCGNIDGNTCMEKFDNLTSCHGYANMPNVCNSDDDGNPSRCLCHQGRSRDSLVSSCENTSEWYSMCTTSLSHNPACHVGEDRNAALCGGDLNFRCEGDAGCNTGGVVVGPECGVPFTDKMVDYQVLSGSGEDLTGISSMFDEDFDLATETTRVIRSGIRYWASTVHKFVMTVAENPEEGTIKLTLEVNPTLDRTIVASKTFLCPGDCCLDDLMEEEMTNEGVLEFDEDYCDNGQCGDGVVYFKRIS